MVVPTGPAEEALRIINELQEQMSTAPPALAQLPGIFFRLFLAADDIASSAAEVERSLSSEWVFAAKVGYLTAVLQACAYCAHACRMPDPFAWRAVLEAQRHSGIAFAIYMSSTEARERQAIVAHRVKPAQREINAAIRTHVLQAAARSSRTTVGNVVGDIVRDLGSEAGAIETALNMLGSSLKTDPNRLMRVFVGYITQDMERLLVDRTRGSIGQQEHRERFARWKKLYINPANR